ncbi:MAG: transposase [Ferruginibacter sp.]
MHKKPGASFWENHQTKEDVAIELTPVGSFVKDSILSISGTYKDVTLGETVVMPNHIHLILHLPFKEIFYNNKQSPLQQIIAPHKGLQPLFPGSVSSIINHLKGKVKKWCNANGYSSFDWQTRFHDHIIRDSKSYNRIGNYIANNIWHWDNDENNQDGNNFGKDIRR